ncbi:cytochrome c biogenesis protein DipZ, partial [Escherichia coli]
LLAGVGAIALGLDTGALAQLSTVTTGSLETKLVDRLGGRSNRAPAATAATDNTGGNATGGAMMAAAADGAPAGAG